MFAATGTRLPTLLLSTPCRSLCCTQLCVMPWRVPSASFPLLASSTASALTARPTCASCRHSWCRTFAKKSKTQTQRGPARVKHARLLGDGKPYHKEQLEGELKVTGLVRSVRKQKHNAFVHISDGTTYAPIQAILSPELAKEYVTVSCMSMESV